MSVESNKAVVRQFIEGFNTGNLDLCVAVVDPNVVVTGVPGLPPGRDAFRQMGELYLAAFPGAQVAVEQMIGEGDWVVAWGTFTGTQQGAMMGIPATGRAVRFPWAHINRVVNGQIVEHNIRQDDLGMLQQLGVIPTPDAVPA